MIKEFRLPDLGEGLTESEILSWKVGVGDTVSLNQVIAEVETAKAVVELPSPFAGVITELHEQPGTVVEVGQADRLLRGSGRRRRGRLRTQLLPKLPGRSGGGHRQAGTQPCGVRRRRRKFRPAHAAAPHPRPLRPGVARRRGYRAVVEAIDQLS